jgi:hypothetical protein
LNKRDLRLDTLRGVFLIIMFLNHWPGPVPRPVSQPLGLVSAAEGFVFLSGLVAGLVFTRLLAAQGRHAVTVRAWGRVVEIYRYHMLALALVIAAGMMAALGGVLPASWAADIEYLPYAPLHAILYGGLLVYQPLYFNILPLYMLLLALLPPVLSAFEAGRERQVLGASVVVWAVSQLGPSQAVANAVAGRLGFASGLYFDPLAWQLLFIAGLWVGHRRHHGRPVLDRGRLLPVAGLAIAVALLWYRYQLKAGLDPVPTLLGVDSSVWISRSGLGPARLLNFAVLAYLIARLGAAFPRLLVWPWAAYLGRHSLEVFAFHVLVAYAARALGETLMVDWSPLTRFTVSLDCVLLLYLPAYLAERRRRAPAAAPAGVPEFTR